MTTEIVTEAPSVEEALDAAYRALGADSADVEYEVLEDGGRRLFGAMRPARVRAWLKGAPSAEEEDLGDEPVAVSEDVALADLPPELRSESPTLSEEEIDKVADEAVGVINEIMRTFGLTPNIEEYEGDDGEIILDIVGDDLGVLIGRHGRTLDALQILVSAISHRRLELRYPTVVDISGYRHRRRQKVEEIAKRAADRAARAGSPVPLRPMTSFERKVVHVALRGDRRVRTESEGNEPYRQVVVHPK